MRTFITLISALILINLSSCVMQSEVLGPVPSREEALRFGFKHDHRHKHVKEKKFRFDHWEHRKLTHRGKGGVRVQKIKRVPRSWRRIG